MLKGSPQTEYLGKSSVEIRPVESEGTSSLGEESSFVTDLPTSCMELRSEKVRLFLVSVTPYRRLDPTSQFSLLYRIPRRTLCTYKRKKSFFSSRMDDLWGSRIRRLTIETSTKQGDQRDTRVWVEGTKKILIHPIVFQLCVRLRQKKGTVHSRTG